MLSPKRYRLAVMNDLTFPAAPPRADAESAARLLDDKQEWLRFSQTQDDARMQEGAPVGWTSHVVIDGMHCAACAFNIEAALLNVPGVRSAEVNATTHRARIVWDEAKVLPSQWMAAIESAGYSEIGRAHV